MANTLGYYNPLFYANEALIQLEKALGMAGRIHRGYDQERRSFGKGEYINIRRPSTFVAQDAPSSAQDLDPGSVQIRLDHWKEVKFGLTDKELSFTTERMIDEHIRPAAYALADDIDQRLNAQYFSIPWLYQLASTTAVTDVTGPRRVMFDNAVPLADVGRIHYEVDGILEEGLLGLAAFSQQQGAGDQGVNTQMRGSLGMKFGLEVFANQNVTSHTGGDMVADTGAQLAGAHTKGATSISIDDATSLSGTIKKGDTLVIAGSTQRYAVTADATASGNAATISITPPLVQNYSDNAAVTLTQDDHSAENLAFHRNAFALATAPLSELGGQLGARIATLTDPITGLSIRSRLFYDGDNSKVLVALDILYGFTTLDPNLAVRAWRA